MHSVMNCIQRGYITCSLFNIYSYYNAGYVKKKKKTFEKESLK